MGTQTTLVNIMCRLIVLTMLVAMVSMVYGDWKVLKDGFSKCGTNSPSCNGVTRADFEDCLVPGYNEHLGVSSYKKAQDWFFYIADGTDCVTYLEWYKNVY